MAFSPSIQSLVGTHSGGVSIGLDWGANRAFEFNTNYLSRYGLLTGDEEAFAPLADMGGIGEDGIPAFIGVAADGNIFITAAGSLYNGAAMLVDCDTLSMINLIGYPPPNFGQGGMVGITYGSTQYCIDKGLGDNIIGVLNRINFDSETAWLSFLDYPHTGGPMCAGAVSTGVAYGLSAPDGGPSQTGPASFTKYEFNGSGFVGATFISDITMADIDSGWTGTFHPRGMCLDQTDGHILAVFSGAGNSNKAYIVKLNSSTGAIVWKTVIPASDGGGAVSTGVTFSYSNITQQRIAFYTGSPARVTIYNTGTGAIDDQYSTGLGGLSNIDGQCYNDAIGGIVLGLNFSNGAGSPTLLNSTPTSWSDGYAVLYVAEPSVRPGVSGKTRVWGHMPVP